MPSARLAQQLEVSFVGPGDIPGLPAEHLNVLLNTHASEWSAVALRRGKKTLVIENVSHSVERREATRMHEMAHIICEHTPKAFVELSSLGIQMPGFDEEQEDEADWLGGCLHLPRPALSWCLKREMDDPAISAQYVASAELVRYRMNITGVRRVRRHLQTSSGYS